MTQSEDIIKRGEELARVIVKTAEAQVNEAQANLDRAKSIADIVLSQIQDVARRLDNHHTGTEKILEGYRVIEGEPRVLDRKPKLAPQAQGLTQYPDEIRRLNTDNPSLSR